MIPSRLSCVTRLFSVAIALLSGCGTAPDGTLVRGDYLSGQNYSYAVYNADNRLIHSPIENLRREIRRREELKDKKGNALKPLSDVYIVCHGWNYTIEESAELYENYRLWLQDWLKHTRDRDRDFEPYFIFVTWGSVSRPISDGLASIAPFDLPTSLDVATRVTDRIVFYLPSNWGETTDAFRLALGRSARWLFDPAQYCPKPDGSEYRVTFDTGREQSHIERLQGLDIPVSTLVDEIIRIKCRSASPGDDRFALHAVGHSFGAKLISLSVFDSVARALLARRYRSAVEAKSTFLDHPRYVDSVVLINPAMKITEMFFPPELPRKPGFVGFLEKLWDSVESQPIMFEEVGRAIGKKALLFTYHDSANGWVFALSQLLLRYEAISEHSVLPEVNVPGFAWVSFAFRFASSFVVTAVANGAALIVEPIDAMVATAQSDSWSEGLENFLSIPFSPIWVQRGLGSTGFRRLRLFSGFFNLRNPWLRGSTREYFNRSKNEAPCVFKRLSEWEAPGVPVREEFYLFDARSVYNGYVATFGAFFGSILNQIIPSKAHGDIRSYDEVDGLEKRTRTLNFLYHFTRDAGVLRRVNETAGERQEEEDCAATLDAVRRSVGQ